MNKKEKDRKAFQDARKLIVLGLTGLTATQRSEIFPLLNKLLVLRKLEPITEKEFES